MSRGNKPKDTSVARLGTALVGAVAAGAVTYFTAGAAAPLLKGAVVGLGAAAPSILVSFRESINLRDLLELLTVIVQHIRKSFIHL